MIPRCSLGAQVAQESDASGLPSVRCVASRALVTVRRPGGPMSISSARRFAAVPCLFIAAAARLDAQAARALTIEDYYRVKTAGGPAFSADARWVAFTVTTRVEENNGS